MFQTDQVAVDTPEDANRPTPTRVHILGPMNSGSSFAEHLLRSNDIPLTDLDFQQVLFKHYPPALVAHLIARLAIPCADILFVAVARDPRVWIESMVRNRYELLFDGLEDRCRLDSAARNFHRSYHEHLTEVGLPGDLVASHLSFDSIFDYWEASYRGYGELARNVRLMLVRYEDLLTDTARSVLAIRQRLCLPTPDTVVIPMRPSKDHGDARSYVDARDKLDALRQSGPGVRSYAQGVTRHIGADLLAALRYA